MWDENRPFSKKEESMWKIIVTIVIGVPSVLALVVFVCLMIEVFHL